MIINLMGAPQAGKSEASKTLQAKLGIPRFSFAAPLRQEVEEFLVSGDLTEDCPNSLKIRFDYIRRRIDLDKFRLGIKTPFSRALLQLWGTEYRRTEDTDYWVEKLQKSTEGLTEFSTDDARFPNEFLWQPDSIIIFIKNKIAEEKSALHDVDLHLSEELRLEHQKIAYTRVDLDVKSEDHLYTITNNYTEQFKTDICNLVTDIKNERKNK